MVSRRIVILGGEGDSTTILYNAMKEHFPIDLVIREKREPVLRFLKRRVRRLGVLTVIGQLAFQLLMVRILKVLSKKRINDIKSIYRLDETPIPSVKVKRVVSANAPETIELLERLSPDLVIVNGTRILSKRVISCVPCRFINTHAGITPRYRGVHGMYWALANDDLAHSGVTVHFVDNGIDTGEIINQKAVSPTKDDNFATYPYLQLGAGIEILIESIYRYFNDAITTRKGTEDSNLWYHPTLWFYLYNRLIRGVK